MMRILYFMLRDYALYTHMEYTHNQTRSLTLELLIFLLFVLSNNPPFLQINSHFPLYINIAVSFALIVGFADE